MVVARVYLMMLLPLKLMIVLVVLVLRLNMVGHMDVKKNIAYSTSIHLVVIALLSCGRFFSFVVVYIMLHGIMKRQLFQSSGYEIHGVGSQDMRKFNMGASFMLIVFAIFILSALVRIVIVRSKEIVVLGVMTLMILLLVVLSIVYTVAYLNKNSIVVKIGEVEGGYVLMLMLMSMIMVDVNFSVWVSLVVFGLVLMIFYGNAMYTVV